MPVVTSSDECHQLRCAGLTTHESKLSSTLRAHIRKPWLLLGNIVTFLFLWFSGISPLNCCPFNVNQAATSKKTMLGPRSWGQGPWGVRWSQSRDLFYGPLVRLRFSVGLRCRPPASWEPGMAQNVAQESGELRRSWYPCFHLPGFRFGTPVFGAKANCFLRSPTPSRACLWWWSLRATRCTTPWRACPCTQKARPFFQFPRRWRLAPRAQLSNPTRPEEPQVFPKAGGTNLRCMEMSGND